MKQLLPAAGNLFVPTENRPLPLLLLSACLAGEPVRYDANHKLHFQLINTLDGRVRFTKICPEVAANLGIPRPPVELRETDQTLRVLGRDDPIDVTEVLQQTSNSLSEGFAQQGLCAAVLQSRSPSCGIASTPIYGMHRQVKRVGDGVFAAALGRHCPDLPLWPDDAISSRSDCFALLSQALLIQELKYLINDGQLQRWLGFYQPLFASWLLDINESGYWHLMSANNNREEFAVRLNILFSLQRKQWLFLHQH